MQAQDIVCSSLLICPVLQFGSYLSAMDLAFDSLYLLAWIDSRPVTKYYCRVLLPALKPVPWPGFIGVAFGIMPLLTGDIFL